MSDYNSVRHEYHRPRYRSETLDSWENEGGSVRQKAGTDRSGSNQFTESPHPGSALLDAVPLGVLITNCDGKITYSNPASQELYVASASTLLGTPWYRTIDARDRMAVSAQWQEDNDDSQPRMFELRSITGTGQRIWTRHSIAKLGDRQTIGDHIHTIEDISEFKAAEQGRMDSLEVLSRESERARVTLECIGDAVISTDVKGQVTYMNTVAESLTGWLRDRACGQPLSQVFRVIDADSGEPGQNPAERAMESLEIVKMPANSLLLRPDGSELGIEDSAAPIHDAEGRLSGAVVIFRDRSFSRESTERMAYLARHDALTGLANRVAFVERFDHAMNLARRHGSQVGLLFIDIDNFKQVNDSLGHKVGDQLLRDLARKLTSCVRSTDLVCRHGGDEFVVLLSEFSQPEDIARVAVKLRSAAARLDKTHGHMLGLDLSIGISLYPENGTDLETLMHRADAAMYHSKFDSGKDYCFYQAGMERPVPGSRFEKSDNLAQKIDGG